jgi:hypothetical protein
MYLFLILEYDLQDRYGRILANTRKTHSKYELVKNRWDESSSSKTNSAAPGLQIV